MITKLDFTKNGNFDLTGTIDLNIMDFNPANLEAKSFFAHMIKTLIAVKKCTAKQLADDNKILYDERIELVKSIDIFLTCVFAMALIDSPEEYHYSAKYKDVIEITIEATKMKYIKGSGKIMENLPAITDYEKWIDINLMEGLKRLISQYDNEGSSKLVKEEIIKLIFNTLYFRYKVEYIR